jgi:hypothetical protein
MIIPLNINGAPSSRLFSGTPSPHPCVQDLPAHEHLQQKSLAAAQRISPQRGELTTTQSFA